MNNLKNYLNKNFLCICLYICIVLILICIINKKYIHGGEIKECNREYIDQLAPTENNIKLYYSGKIYNIKKYDSNAKIYNLLYNYMKEGYIIKIGDKEKKDSGKDLTKFFNYYEKIKEDNKDNKIIIELYQEKKNIIKMLNNLIPIGVICLNNI